MKTSAEPIPVVVVGGGSILLGDTLPGASELVKPEHFAVANAIGAAIAQVGGEVDRVFSLERHDRATRRSSRRSRRRSRRPSRPAPSATASRSSTSRTCRSRTSPGERDADPRQGGRRPRAREVSRCGWSVRPSSTTSPSAPRSSAPAAAATRTSGSCSRRQAIASTARSRSCHGRRGSGRRARRALRDDGRADGDGREAPARRRDRSAPSRRCGSYLGRRADAHDRRSRPAGSTRRRRSSSRRSSASRSSTPTGWAARSPRSR